MRQAWSFPHGSKLTRWPWLTTVLTSLAIGFHLLPNTAAAYSLSRSGMEEGAWWLVLTGHFTHWDQSHFLWDTLVFAFLGARCELFSRRAFGLVVLTSAWAVAMGFLVLLPHLESYRGLSGIDSGLFALLLVFLWRCRKRMALWPKLLLTLGFISKMIFEVFQETPLFVASAGSDFVVVPSAHIIGACCGLLVGCIFQPKKRGLQRQPEACQQTLPLRVSETSG